MNCVWLPSHASALQNRWVQVFLVLIAAVSFARAQTNADNAPTNSSPVVMPAATATTNAPAATIPPTPDAADLAAPAPLLAPPVSSPFTTTIAPGQTNAPPQQEDIADIRPPFFFIHSHLWLWLLLAVIAFIILLWKWLHDRRLISPKTAYELTLEKLEKARAMLREDNPMPYAVFISETIRTYLGQRFQAPSTRRTTEEFLRQMENDRATPLAEYRDLLREFLQSCDLVKFARYQPTLTELEQVQQRATTFVTATKPVPVPANPPTGKLP